MTIEQTKPRSVYTISTAGPYALRDSYGNPWPYFAGGVQVSVVKNGQMVILAEGADFTITPTSGNAGNLTLTTAALAAHVGGQLIITRATQQEQAWQAVQGPREVGLAAQLDRAIMIIQEQQVVLDGTLRLASGSLPPAVMTEGRLVLFGANGFESGPSPEDIADAAQNAETATQAAEQAAQSAQAAQTFDPANFLTKNDNLAGLSSAPTALANMGLKATAGELNAANLSLDKWSAVMVADLQPKNTSQIGYTRAVLTDIEAFVAAHDRRVLELRFLGDLVDTASVDNTGAAPLYGYPELLADIGSRRLPPLFVTSGNHDLDGSGDDLHERNWSMRTFEEFFPGSQFYTVTRGNIMSIYLGDMGGSTHGEQTEAALRWFENQLAHSSGYNVEVYLHQPIYGTWDASVAAYNSSGWPSPLTSMSTAYQWASQRLAAAIAAHDNVAAVFYGHVGTDYATSTQIVTQFGCPHIGLQMGLERAGRAENGGATAWANHYVVIDYAAEATTALLRRRDAKTGAWISGSDYTITYKYPLLGSAAIDDGRGSISRTHGVAEKSLTVAMRTSDERYEASPGNWLHKPGVRWGSVVDYADTTIDNMNIGDGAGLLVRLPAGDLVYVGDNQITADPGSIDAGGFAVVRAASADADTASDAVVYARASSGGIYEAMRVRGVDGLASFAGQIPVKLTSANNLNNIGAGVAGEADYLLTWSSSSVPSNGIDGICICRHMQYTDSAKVQVAWKTSNAGEIYHRNYTGGAWTPWRCLKGGKITTTGSTSYTIGEFDEFIACSNAANVTLTLPSAASHEGRQLMIRNVSAAKLVNSASSNVVPITSQGTAGTAILPATIGAWARLVSDGTAWITVARGT